VPEPALPRWRKVTGGEIAEIACEADALRRWWGQALVGSDQRILLKTKVSVLG
jgi:hypothetical protein